jgi:predicted acyl esterase
VDWLQPRLALSQSLDTHNAIAFVGEPFPRDMEVSGLVRASLEVEINKKDFDFNLRLCELTNSGLYVLLPCPYQQRASLLKDRSHRQLMTPGVPHILEVETGLVCRLIRAAERLVALLDVNKERDVEVNYGSGRSAPSRSPMRGSRCQ